MSELHQGVFQPSPIADHDLAKVTLDQTKLPTHDSEANPSPNMALFIHSHLARQLTIVTEAMVHHGHLTLPSDIKQRFLMTLDELEAALPSYFLSHPQTNTRHDSVIPHIVAHRVRLHLTLLSCRFKVTIGALALTLKDDAARRHAAQGFMAAVYTNRSAKLLDPKLSDRLFDPPMVFQAAVMLALYAHVDHAEANLCAQYRTAVRLAIELLNSLHAATISLYAQAAVRILQSLLDRAEKAV